LARSGVAFHHLDQQVAHGLRRQRLLHALRNQAGKNGFHALSHPDQHVARGLVQGLLAALGVLLGILLRLLDQGLRLLLRRLDQRGRLGLGLSHQFGCFLRPRIHRLALNTLNQMLQFFRHNPPRFPSSSKHSRQDRPTIEWRL
jgi:hypothetical protein